MEDLKLEMPLDKDAEFEKARDALLGGNFSGFEAIRDQVPSLPPLPFSVHAVTACPACRYHSLECHSGQTEQCEQTA